MGSFQENFIFPLLTNLSDFHLCFIDDIFLIWNGTTTEFDIFLKKMNVILASNLSMKYLKQKSIFLTPQCLKQITNYKLKCMSTNRQSHLHSKSEHPNSTKKSIAYSQALRFNKICHNRSDLHNNCKQLLIMLTKRGTIKEILQHKSIVLF